MAMDILPLDFVSLPIIVTDYDAVIESKNHAKTPTVEIERSQTSSQEQQKPPGDQKEEEKLLGITESVEEIWSRISDAMKTKLREACIEVLRRTDAPPRNNGNSFQYDNDARFLD